VLSASTHLFAGLSASTAVTSTPSPAVLSTPPAADTTSPLAVPSDLTATEVSCRGSGGLAMHGTVLSPAAAKPARPGMVLVHGAGAGPRTKLMGEAVELAETTDEFLLRWQLCCDRAEVALAAGDPTEARAALEQAVERAERKGAVVLVDRARQRLAEL